MASLQTLRNKGGLIVAIVIAIALLSFVLGDLLTSGSTLFGGGQNVGEINGTKISAQQYQEQVTTLSEVLKVTSGTQTLTEEQSQMVQSQAWEQLVLRYATSPALADAGIAVGLNEMAELISGRYVSPMVQQFFANPADGQFDAGLLRQFLSNMDQDPSGSLQLFWTNLQSDVHSEALMNKFKVVVDKGSYVTNAQAEFIANLEGAKYNVSFVAEELSSIADSTVTVTDAEIREYFKNNSASMQRPETRNIEYVVFNALPSRADYAAAAKYMAGLKEEFEAATDVKQFASLNGQEAMDTRYYKEGQLSGDLGTFAFSASAEDIYAPEMSADQYVIARISDKKVLPDSVNFSHILLEPSNVALADSLRGVIAAAPAKFGELALEFSMDQTVAQNEGVIGTVDPQGLFADFSTPLMAMKKGEVKVISLPGSLHVVKVNDVKGESEKVQVASIKYTVEASEETRAASFNEAASFIAKAKKQGLVASANEADLSIRTANLSPTARELQGYDNSREVVRWTYNNEVGAISDVMEFGNSFIVSTVSKITNKGLSKVEDESANIARILRTEKKGNMIAAKMNGSVEQVAASLDKEVATGEDITFTTYVAPGVGFDIAFAGGVTSLKEGVTSKPIIGKTAVYVVKAEEVVSSPVSSEMIKERLTAELQQSAFYKAYQTLVEKSSINDERYKFF